MAELLDQKTKRWTYEEYYQLDDDQRYEIIDGNLLMAPSPTSSHQDWVGNLFGIIWSFVRKKKTGKIFVAPLDVVLDEHNVVQPDLVFVSNARREIIQSRAIFGNPDLAIETISPSSVQRDRYIKKELYAKFGVQECWICDPLNKSVEVWVLKKGEYQLHCFAEIKGKITSSVLAGLEFDLIELDP